MAPLWALAALAAVSAAVWLVLRRARAQSRCVSELLETAERLARGEHGARSRVPMEGKAGRLGSALNRLAEGLERDFTRLRRLEAVHKEFVADVSHELRTPLASVKAYAETLREGAVEDAEHRLEFIQEIERNVERMTRLVNDLLELSALESGSRPPALEPVSLMRIAGEVTASLKPLAERKRVVLRLDPFHDLPELRGDRNQLKQVFTNLIDNAIKFAGDKGVVRISARAQNGMVEVAVEDNGIGIPPEDLPRIFERFYRVDKARSRELGGTGLGLSIVKQIVEAHCGSVAVESPQGRGTTVRFTLPA